MTGGRLRARRHGLWAETLAVAWLRFKGYGMVARRLAAGRGTGAGEVDIVARRGGVLAFVEVKFRPTLAQAAEAVGAPQRRRIARSAALFLARRPDLAGLAVRFDAILVAPWRLPRHLPDAWRADP
ncbi:MAG: YraN family protein [Magnetospirillum sp.]|nr:YraN family protein [Magnetospirillum sp.]